MLDFRVIFGRVCSAHDLHDEGIPHALKRAERALYGSQLIGTASVHELRSPQLLVRDAGCFHAGYVQLRAVYEVTEGYAPHIEREPLVTTNLHELAV